MKEMQREQRDAISTQSSGGEEAPAHEAGYYIGIDGGGSKTLAVIVDANGRELGRGLAGSSNQTVVGYTGAVASIQLAVAEAWRAAQLAGPAHRAWLGLSGVDRPEDILLFQPHLRNIAAQVEITNDANLLLGALKESIGITLIAGTGSIAFGCNRAGESVRAGGWGYLLGDEGSGYLLACQGLRAAVRFADGRGPRTLLLEAMLRFWGLIDAEQLLAEVYKDDEKARIARLSGCVFAAARQGDHVAQEIVREGVHELVLMVETIQRRPGFALEPLRLALGGGLLLHEQEYREALLAELGQHQSIEQVELVTQPALSAARFLIEERLERSEHR